MKEFKGTYILRLQNQIFKYPLQSSKFVARKGRGFLIQGQMNLFVLFNGWKKRLFILHLTIAKLNQQNW